MPLSIPNEIRYARRKADRSFSSLVETCFRSEGIQADWVRPYTRGDDINHFNWNLLAREGRRLVNLHRPVREQGVVFVVDSKSFTVRSSPAKFEKLMRSVSLLGTQAYRAGHPVGALFDASGEKVFIRPSRDYRIVPAVMESLKSKLEHAGGSLLDRLCFLRKVKPGGCRIVLISDFLEPEQDLDQLAGHLKLTAGRQGVIIVTIRSVNEEDFPRAGMVRFYDPETEKTCVRNTSSRAFRAWLEQRRAQRTGFHEKLIAAGAKCVYVRDDEDPLVKMKEAFSKK